MLERRFKILVFTAVSEVLPSEFFDMKSSASKNNVFNDLKFSLLNIALLGV